VSQIIKVGCFKIFKLVLDLLTSSYVHTQFCFSYSHSFFFHSLFAGIDEEPLREGTESPNKAQRIVWRAWTCWEITLGYLRRKRNSWDTNSHVDDCVTCGQPIMLRGGVWCTDRCPLAADNSRMYKLLMDEVYWKL
jgi:hypothetical protein